MGLHAAEGGKGPTKRTSADMMKQTTRTVYEMYKNGQMEDVVMMMDKDITWDFSASRVPGGVYRGRDQIRQSYMNHMADLEMTSYTYDILEADEGRGTVLVHVEMKGKMRKTGKSFHFQGYNLLRFENGIIKYMKCWGNERDMVKASMTPAMETFEKIEKAFFSGDMDTLRTVTGKAKITALGNTVDPAVGVWTHEQWMEKVQMFYWEYTSMEVIHATKNRVMVAYTANHWGIKETGQSLMGHKPEDFRFYVHMETDDSGTLKAMELHMTPQPSEFLFARPSGGASMAREL